MGSSTSFTRVATIALLGSRVAYGAALLAAPARVAGGRWLGPGADEPAARVALRGLGAREVAVHTAAIVAVLRGRPVRPWLAASIAGDLSDIASTAFDGGGLPDGSAPATAVVAGVSALLSAAAVAANPA